MIGADSRRIPDASEARAFLERSSFIWHQKFEIGSGVFTPGVNDVGFLLERSAVPANLSGARVLDIGTSNGGAAFELERRGAAQVVAVDIYPEDWFGFAAIRAFLNSRVEYVQASVYELPTVLDHSFDLVIFWGVLYHLRHPLLALDAVRRLTCGTAVVESAVMDSQLPQLASQPLVRFLRRDELGHDGSNWFLPTVACLLDWCASSGLEPQSVHSWPDGAPTRALVNTMGTEGAAEYEGISYERPLSVLPVIHGRGL